MRVGTITNARFFTADTKERSLLCGECACVPPLLSRHNNNAEGTLKMGSLFFLIFFGLRFERVTRLSFSRRCYPLPGRPAKRHELSLRVVRGRVCVPVPWRISLQRILFHVVGHGLVGKKRFSHPVSFSVSSG